MALNKRLVGGMLAVLLGAGSGTVLPMQASLSSQRRAQVTSDSVTVQLDERSHTGGGQYTNVHTFEAVAGQKLSMEIVSEASEISLSLLGPDGDVVIETFAPKDDSTWFYRLPLPETGTYQFVANSYSAEKAGQYTLTWALTAVPAPFTAGDIAGQLDGNSQTFEDGIPFDLHTFEGTASDPILLEMTSDDFDAALILVKPDGEVLASYDGGGAGSNVRFMLRLPDTGTYQLYATASTPRASGAYRLSWRALTEAEEAELPSWNQTYYSDRPFEWASAQDESTNIMQSSITQGVPLLEEQLAISRAQLGDNHPAVAHQLSGLAGLYLMQRRYADAESLLSEALSIYRTLPEAYSEEIAKILESLELVAYGLGQLDEASALSDQAGEIREDSDLPRRMYDESSLVQTIETARRNSQLSEVVDAIDALADIYNRQGRYDEAESLYKEAIEIRRATSVYEGIEHPEIARSLNGLALLYQAQGRYDAAELLYREALAIWETFNRSPTYSPVYEASLQIHTKFPILYNLAGLYQAMGDISQAVSTLRTALDIEERNLDATLANSAEMDRMTYLAQRTQIANTPDQVLSLNLNAALNSPAATQLALTTLLRRKGRLLEASIRTQEIFRQYATPEELELLNQLTQIRQEIANLTLQPPTDLTAAEYQTRLTRLRSEANQLETILARRSAGLALDSSSVQLEAVREQIPADGVLIEYALYRPFDPFNPLSEEGVGLTADGFEAPRYAAYLLFPDGTIEAIDLGEAAAIDAAIDAFGALLQDPSAARRSGIIVSPRTDSEEDITETNRTLRALIFDPIAPYLQGRQHLLISPDSQLNRLPFEAIATDRGYLVNQYQISYLNSGRDLLKFDASAPSSAPAVVLANPNYDVAATAETHVVDHRRSDDLSQLQVGALPGTADEAEAIKPLLPNATVLLANEATEHALKQVASPRILHIATHGFFLQDAPRSGPADNRGLLASPGPRAFSQARTPVENPLLRSGLALAGFNQRRSGSEDGVFTALEAANLNLLGTRLVVLSACDTGLGEIASGEGVYGLRWAFAIAGAETQLLSLWQVSDYGTQSLMARYYEKLTNGMGRSEALRAVQLEMIAEEGEYSHPYYWAAFILAGDWRAL